MKNRSHVFCMIGISGLVCGLLSAVAQLVWGELPPVVTSVLSGITAVVVVRWMNHSYAKAHPEQAKQAKIAETDERNVAIRNQSAYYMYTVSFLSISCLALAFTLLKNQQAANLTLLLLAIHVIGYFIVHHFVSRKF